MQDQIAQSKGERTRQLILSGAAHLFSANGFYKTGIEDIARTLKIARGTLYQYFPGKEDLLLSVLHWSESILISEMKNLSPKKQQSIESFFSDMIRVFINHSKTHGDLFGIYFSVSPVLTEGYREKELPPFSRIIAVIENLFLESGTQFNENLRCFELGTLAFLTIESIRMTISMNGQDEDIDELIQRRAGLFLNGVLSQDKESTL